MNWGSTWDFLWHFLIIFGWIAYLLVLFQILTDLFWRDHQTSGFVKAIWVFFLIVFPWLGALVYLLARGKGMSERARAAAQAGIALPTMSRTARSWTIRVTFACSLLPEGPTFGSTSRWTCGPLALPERNLIWKAIHKLAQIQQFDQLFKIHAALF